MQYIEDNRKMKSNKRGSINPNVTLRLWVKAGGRCEICNKYLLEDELTTQPLNLADRAHNVGVSGGKRSARSKSILTLEERNSEVNLLLLCKNHHKLIDTYPDKYPVEFLKEIKLEHEKMIKDLTGMTDDRKSVVLRMMNNIKGNSISISDEELRETLFICEKRFPDFLLNKENNIEINLKNLPEFITPAYWEIGKQIIDFVVEKQIEPKTDDKNIKHISVFALARIPFLVYLGYRLGDKIPTDIYQKQKNENENWIWGKNHSGIKFTASRFQKGKNESKVALIASISGKVHKSNLPKFIDSDYTLYEIKPKSEIPNRNIIRSKKTLVSFRESYQKLLRLIESENPGLDELLFFPAIPLSAAVHCGRELLKGPSPALTIFDMEKSKYIKTITIPKH